MNERTITLAPMSPKQAYENELKLQREEDQKRLSEHKKEGGEEKKESDKKRKVNEKEAKKRERKRKLDYYP